MFNPFTANSELLSSHWSVIIGIGIAFLLVQLVLTTRLYLRARRQNRILVRLARNFERGRDGRGDLRSLPWTFTWIRWVLSIFPDESTISVGNYTRDEVLQELDNRISGDSDYLLLQRMGVMAPLLGVILTVVGFYWLEVNESEEQSLQSILLAVTPLVSGVGTGAVLALINQALLHVVGSRIELLRLSARTWFDTVIWSFVGMDTEAATVKAIAAFDRFAQSVAESADRHASSSGRLEESTASLQDAASRFDESVKSFNGEIKGIPETLFDLRSATAASADALRELIPVGSRALANLDVSVAAFRSTIDREFAEAATLHNHSSRLLAQSVQQIGDSTKLLTASSEGLRQTTGLNVASFKRMDESIRQHVVPGNQLFHEAVQVLMGQMADLSKLVGALGTNVDAMASAFEKMAGGLVPSISSLCEAVDNRLGVAVTEHRGQVESIGRSVERLQESTESLSIGATALNSMLAHCTQSVDRAAATHEALTATAKGLADVGARLRRNIESDVAPSQRAMNGAAISFAQSAAQLTEFIDRGLRPATSEFATLRETLAGLEEVVDSIKDLSHAREDVDRLTETLARAAEISDAISSLPEQVQDILEQNAVQNAALAIPRGGFRTWLAKRPR